MHTLIAIVGIATAIAGARGVVLLWPQTYFGGWFAIVLGLGGALFFWNLKRYPQPERSGPTTFLDRFRSFIWFVFLATFAFMAVGFVVGSFSAEMRSND